MNKSFAHSPPSHIPLSNADDSILANLHDSSSPKLTLSSPIKNHVKSSRSNRLAIFKNTARNCSPASTDVWFTPQYNYALAPYITPQEITLSIARINFSLTLIGNTRYLSKTLQFLVPVLMTGSIISLIIQLSTGEFPFMCIALSILTGIDYVLYHLHSQNQHAWLRSQLIQALASETAHYLSRTREQNGFKTCRFRSVRKKQLIKTRDPLSCLFRREDYTFVIEGFLHEHQEHQSKSPRFLHEQQGHQSKSSRNRNDPSSIIRIDQPQQIIQIGPPEPMIQISTPTQSQPSTQPQSSDQSPTHSRNVSIRIETPKFSPFDPKPLPVDNRWRGDTISKQSVSPSTNQKFLL